MHAWSGSATMPVIKKNPRRTIQCPPKQKETGHKEHDKRGAQEQYSYKTVSFDLEQVLTTPWSNVSSLYYSGTLNTYNLAVYELGIKEANCYMWHEGEGGHGSSFRH